MASSDRKCNPKYFRSDIVTSDYWSSFRPDDDDDLIHILFYLNLKCLEIQRGKGEAERGRGGGGSGAETLNNVYLTSVFFLQSNIYFRSFLVRCP